MSNDEFVPVHTSACTYDSRPEVTVAWVLIALLVGLILILSVAVIAVVALTSPSLLLNLLAQVV